MMGLKMKHQHGNALFLILIAVALFAALSYAITQSSRGGGNIDKEQAKLDTAVSQLCVARVSQAVMRLKITGGCTEDQISYEYNGLNINEGAPEDKHCHIFDPAGAGETPCGTYEGCSEETTAAGAVVSGGVCDGLVYVSDSLGYRLYTTLADIGVGDLYDLEDQCKALGFGWHLPDQDELRELCLAQNTGALNNTFADDMGGMPYYWSSTPMSDDTQVHMYFVGGGCAPAPLFHIGVNSARCVRQ